VIDGLLGADFMVGGMGDDTYVIDNGSDRITEQVGGGTDTAESSIYHQLQAAVENLVLTGSNAVGGLGNELGNRMTGNGANNMLTGGLGADLLTGGGGNDLFAYRSVAESTAASRDQILDFTLGDKIDLRAIDATANTPANNHAFAFDVCRIVVLCRDVHSSSRATDHPHDVPAGSRHARDDCGCEQLRSGGWMANPDCRRQRGGCRRRCDPGRWCH
jgi:hypothetical protein